MANSNPKIIHQIATRKNDFTKPIEHYAVIDIFGKNVVTSEGSAWRNHRKITSSSFNERSNALVWRESIHQAEAMLASWAMREGNDTDCMSVDGVYPDAATTSLHVVSRSGFGVRLLWPGEKGELDEGDEYEWFSSERPKGGHTMTFKESMRIMLSDFIWMGVFSKRTLGESIAQYRISKNQEADVNQALFRSKSRKRCMLHTPTSMRICSSCSS